MSKADPTEETENEQVEKREENQARGCPGNQVQKVFQGRKSDPLGQMPLLGQVR